jgi:gamma-glutamyltranspeptidase/glutathione hydrolase
MAGSGGVVAAGHAVSAAAGARVLRAGGNAVDAAVGAMLMSCVAEPLLTGIGAGGYLMVAGFDAEPTLLDFFVAAPGLGAPEGAARADLLPVVVDFGDAEQVFNVGPSSVGAWGVPAGIEAALGRWGSMPLAELTAGPAALAREGVTLNRPQGYVNQILGGILTSTPEAAAIFAPGGHLLGPGDRFRWPDLALALERLGSEGTEPFTTGAVALAVCDWLTERGGVLTRTDIAEYRAIERTPVAVDFHGRKVLTNPPPNAGGILIADALARLEAGGGTGPERLVEVMEQVQARRTPEFVAGLDETGFAERFLASRLGSTTHISVMDGEGRACAVTCTNGEGSGVVVPGTGIHPNNIMGEEDLNPLGFHAFPAGRRMPSMMAPTIVLGADGVELVVGSAGSNRIRSAIVQTIVGVVDRGLSVADAVEAPRVHFEEGTVYAEPGVDVAALEAAGRTVSRFSERNLFFGGVQAVRRDPVTGRLGGAGDSRRGGAAVGQ